mgnify:FL=1
METWNYQNPVKIIFGCGSRKLLKDTVKNSKILIVSSKRGRQFIEKDPFLIPISKNSKWIDSISSNPSLDHIQKEFDKNDYKDIEIIIAFGGGSSIDAAKAIAAGISINSKNIMLYDLIKNPNEFLKKPTLPIIAIPTTSGTGSEVTSFATIWDQKNKKKLSLQHDTIYPQLAIVDPELTYDLPYKITISSGLDALNQALESIWNKNKSPISSLTASKAIKKALKALPFLEKNIKNIEARKLISEASLLAGISISQTRTAICHSISYPLTAKYGIEHGIACAFTMYAVSKKVNASKKDIFSDVLRETDLESSESLINKIKEIVTMFKVRENVAMKLAHKDEIYNLINEMITPGRSDNFILPINQDLIKDILEESLR